ncbi:hypothetical protein B0T26DRAFT_769497 [Lasiosphaeria miniovina]|uniref:E3 ubiquitin-protein ligase listerin n=1 Tax=Lasiosphaeria miniovina TaxID=1954250 RepID=A0AA40ATL9_9PEZI|nr:uncharacterized protein B0T26DRAFT_769497 [Lasiosphaeria miniovina]KAK0721795.1 hypothetical protein B0T26DRAFT_769497 [Lasiosphaeria miniovina]
MATGGGFGGFATSSTTLSYITPPPNLSDIPQDVIVPFKNLLKKDSTTKLKALEEILAYAQSHPYENGGVEEPVLEAWTTLYARLSIDNARRVRELSHTLLIELLKSAKTRMEKRVSSIIGPWLAGTFDKDKGVARIATEGLASLLKTEEKLNQFWRKLQSQILDFAIEAIRESPSTLSDLRSSTPEDANGKYFRVVGCSLSLVLALVRKAEPTKLQGLLGRYFEVDSIWSLATAEEPFVRRTLFQLLQTCVETSPESIKSRLPQIGRAIFVDGLKTAQSGSATDFVAVMASLTKTFPQIWGTKQEPLSRLQRLVEKGSQGGSAAYWQELDRLLAALGKKPISPAMVNFMKSLRTGISDRLEPRANAPYGWRVYLNMLQRAIDDSVPSSDFLNEAVFPLTRQFLHPTPELSSWTAPSDPPVFPLVWRILARHSNTAVRESAKEEWQRLSASFSSRIANSDAEDLKSSEKSKFGLAEEGDRWFKLVASIVKENRLDEDKPLLSTITASSSQILKDASDLLSRRDYRHTALASIIQSAFKHCPATFADESLFSSLFPLDNATKLKTLVNSESFRLLAPCLEGIAETHEDQFQVIWNALIASSINPSDPPSLPAISTLISTPSGAGLAIHAEPLQAFLISNWLRCVQNPSSDAWKVSEASLEHGAVGSGTLESIASSLVERLNVPTMSGPALEALEMIIRKEGAVFSKDQQLHIDLITRLLALTEISNPSVVNKVRVVRALLDNHRPAERHPLIAINEKNLDDVGPSSLGLDVLVQQAVGVLEAGNLPEEDLFPNVNVWMAEMRQFLRDTPNPSLSLTSTLGGAYFLVKKLSSPPLADGGQLDDTESPPKRDGQGRSIPARMAVFTSKLLSHGVKLASLPDNFQVELLYLLCLTKALAADQLTVMQPELLWRLDQGEEGSAEVEEFVALVDKIMNDVVADASDWRQFRSTDNTLVGRLIGLLLRSAGNPSPAAFYSAKVLGYLFQLLTEAHGPPLHLEAWFGELGVMKATPSTIFVAAAFLTGFGEALTSSTTVSSLCNRLVSEVMSSSPSSPKTLFSAVLMNSCLSVYQGGQIPVENRKLVFVLKQMTSWTSTPAEVSNQLAAETCKAIQQIHPHVKDVYGPYWEQTVDYCIWLWNKAAKDRIDIRLPYLHSSLKLMSTLELSCAAGEANEDLAEVLEQRSWAKSKALIGLLKTPRNTNTQPCQIVDAILCRAVENIPLKNVDDLSALYEQVASGSRAIQQAAFGLLHRALPAAQEEISVDVLLEDKVARLPDELLSLLLEPPTLEAYPYELVAQFPGPVRTYLLSWHLIFDACSKASYKVRGDYAELLKEQSHFSPFMTFMFDVLGHSAADAINLEKEGFTVDHIRSYSLKLAEAEPEERNLHWLLIHLFYLTLKHLPGLFKTWYYLVCSSKQTKIAIDSWIPKYLSPIIMSEALDDVVEWAENQPEPGDDEKELVVQVSKTSRQITAGYEIDDEIASIFIRIPSEYPLGVVEVGSVSRVAIAVDDRKWKAWIKATEGQIMFSASMSFTEGLTVFRQNVRAAMKGHTECAICYSIVSSDKKLPDKECETCKHCFHRVCLYKWFSTSERNTCPLCRNPIDYLGPGKFRRN